MATQTSIFPAAARKMIVAKNVATTDRKKSERGRENRTINISWCFAWAAGSDWIKVEIIALWISQIKQFTDDSLLSKSRAKTFRIWFSVFMATEPFQGASRLNLMILQNRESKRNCLKINKLLICEFQVEAENSSTTPNFSLQHTTLSRTSSCKN